MQTLLLILVSLATQPDRAFPLSVPVRHSPTVADARGILVQLQNAIRANDHRRIAALIQFPLGVRKGKLAPTYVPSVKVFMRTHALVFTRRVSNAILAEDPASLALRDGLVRIGGGAAAIGLRCESVERATCRAGVVWVSIIDDPSVP
jgi:hypothetical protein